MPQQYYCLSCNKYYSIKELLPGNLCPLHERPVKEVK